jgi:hypothetical protein
MVTKITNTIGGTMPMTKKQYLEQTVMCDEWGRPPSLADVPLTYMKRSDAFAKRDYSEDDITILYEQAIEALKKEN